MVWFCNWDSCSTTNADTLFYCQICGTKRSDETDSPKEEKEESYSGPKTKKVLCSECEFTFWTIYDERVSKRKCGDCMPDLESRGAKLNG